MPDDIAAPTETTDITAPHVESAYPTQTAEGESSPDFSQLKATGTEKAPEETGDDPETKQVVEEAKSLEKPEEKKPEEVKTETKPEPEQKKEEPKKEDKPEPKLLSDEEIAALQTKKNVPEKIVRSFNEMKGLLGYATKTARQAAAERDQLRTELEQAKTGALTPEIKAELDQLRNFRQTWDTENTPEFQQRVEGEFKKADEAFWALLKSPELGLDEEGEADVRAHLDKNYDPAWIKQNILKPLEGDPILEDRVKRALYQRFEAADNRQKELSNIQQNREKIIAEATEKRKQHEVEWVDKARAVTNKLAEKYQDSWAAFKQAPEGATPEQKATIDTHNKQVEAKAKEFQETIAKVYGRDPEKTTQVIFESMQAQHLEGKLKEAEAELAKKSARVEELENLISKARGAGRQASVTAPPADTDNEKGGPKKLTSGDTHQAFENFFANR